MSDPVAGGGYAAIDPTRPAVLVAGGQGITAFEPFLESLGPETPQPVLLVYGVRSTDHMHLVDLVLAQLARVPSFQAQIFVEAGPTLLPAELDVESALRLPTLRAGVLAFYPVWPVVQSFDHPVFYLAGPDPMVAVRTADLEARGIDPADIRHR